MKTPIISGSTAPISQYLGLCALRTGWPAAGAVRILARLFPFRSPSCTCYSMQQRFMPEELYAEVEI